VEEARQYPAVTGTVRDPVHTAFAREQRAGYSAALQGRLVVLVVIAAWILYSRLPPVSYYMIGLVGMFALLGAAQLWAVRRGGVENWVLYLLIAADVAILTVALLLSGPVTRDLPVQISFRFDNFIFFFLVVASAAFSYSPRLVMWSGAAIAVSWVVAGVVVDLSGDFSGWADIPTDATPETYLAMFLDPNFFGLGSRLQEALAVVVVSGLLAVVAWRGRRVVFRQAEAERERASIAETFGKYVPEEVAHALIADQGAFKPQERTATVMFTDIVGFTALAETMQPADVLTMLDDYFEGLGSLISAEGGVVGQFQGDALIATFNVPVPSDNHAAAAMRAALAIQDMTGSETFRGKHLRTRIGLNTGPVVSGSVGSRGRRSYTVYGDVVNAAARIEALNKELGTMILAAESTVSAAGAGFEARKVADRTMRGRSEPTSLFEIKADASASNQTASEMD
jgi:adenylate cyclase